MNVIDVVKKINLLYQTLKQQGDSAEESATKINDILIFGEKISPNLLGAAWDLYAQEQGVQSQ